MITSFDKSNLQNLRHELNELLAAFGSEHGVEFDLGGLRFTPTEATGKLAIRVLGATPGKVVKSNAQLESAMRMHNLKRVSSNGDELVGYNSKAFKYPFIVLRKADGKRYKYALKQLRGFGA